MKLSDHAHGRLYALTSLASLIWLVQSLTQAHADVSLLTWPTAIFSLCLAIVVAYTGYCGFRMIRSTASDPSDASASASVSDPSGADRGDVDDGPSSRP